MESIQIPRQVERLIMTMRRQFRPSVSKLDDRILLSHAGGKIVSPMAQVAANDPAVTPTEGNPVYTLAQWDDFHKSYVAEATADHPRVVFLGDSITYFWQNPFNQSLGETAWHSTLAPLGAENYGIAGDRTQNLLWRVDNGEVSSHPKLVVLLIGINNLGNGATPAETAAGVAADIAAIHAKSPRSKVLLLGILPNELTIPSESNANVTETNAMLSGAFKADPYVSYLDLTSHFESADGTPIASLYHDGLHPSPQGYQVLADALVGPIKTLLKGRKLDL